MGTLDDDFVAPNPRELPTSGEVLLSVKVRVEDRDAIKRMALDQHMTVKDLILKSVESQAKLFREQANAVVAGSTPEEIASRLEDAIAEVDEDSADEVE